MTKKKVKILKSYDMNFKSELKSLLSKDDNYNHNVYDIVFEIIQKVRKSGDSALLELIRKFDKIEVDKVEKLNVDKSTLKLAYESLPKRLC